MNYEKLYHKLIESSKSKNRKKGLGVYFEDHHILPKSMGGSDEIDNMVLLTGREHIICHYLLMKFVKGEPFKTYMTDALNGMRNQEAPNQSRYKLKSKLYERVKIEASINQSKRTLNYIATHGHPMTGYIWSEEQNKARSEKRLDIKLPDQWKENIRLGKLDFYSKNDIWNKGIPSTQEHKDKISAGLKDYYKDHPGRMTGRSHSEESKQKMKNRDWSDYQTIMTKAMENVDYSEIHKKVKCEVCDKEISRQNYSKFHGSECGKPKPQSRVSCVVCKKVVTPSTLVRFHSHRELS